MSDYEPWDLIITPAASRDLKRLQPTELRRVMATIDALTGDPMPPASLKLQGIEDERRVRVGVFRIRYRLDQPARAVVVLQVRHRREAY